MFSLALDREATRPRLLLFFAPADHPHRDAACATLAWLAEAEGMLFECYYESDHTGIHFGGGHPSHFSPADLRGGTVIGGRHFEALELIVTRFRCEVASLGQGIFLPALREAGVPVRSTSGDIATFYAEVFARSGVPVPSTLLVIGDGGRPQGIPLTPYAFPEVAYRRLLAISDGDIAAVTKLAGGRSLEGLWVPRLRAKAIAELGLDLRIVADSPDEESVAAQTVWMSRRWLERSRGFVLGDPELIGRWIPTAVREGWAALYGVPQSDAVDRMADRIAAHPVVFGRQQHDQDFFQLSRLGVAFQVIDPGRPPFPVVRKITGRIEASPVSVAEPPTEQLEAWANEGRVLATLLFWTGMIRELENLYALIEILTLTAAHAGLVVTTETYAHMRYPPLSLVTVPREAGGTAPRVELLLGDAGKGVLVAADCPPDRFASTLRESVRSLGEWLADDNLVPKGWWGTMDAQLRYVGAPRISAARTPPWFRIRYKPRSLITYVGGSGRDSRFDARASVRRSPLGRFFSPLRPYDAYAPGAPSRAVLAAVRAAGFEYAFTKSGAGATPRVAEGIDGLTVLNYTAGRWDGWTPFVTVNDESDLESAERKLLARARPGWLVSTVDSCLWTFSGHVWARGAELEGICRWIARGGRSGRLINVTPRTVARYARLLVERRQVERIRAV